MKKLLQSFRTPSVAQLVQEEMEQLQVLMYQEDRRADYHRAQAEAYTARFQKLKESVTEHNARTPK